MIPVTRPFFPPLQEVVEELEGVWRSGWLTNRGPLVQRLEVELAERFGTPVAVLANGTLALQLAVRALGLRGKVATTPFSFVATTSALVWEQCEPLFVDVEEDTWNLSAAALRELDDEEVTGVLATHVYGVCCDAGAIGSVAAARGWRTLYDAAHAFGSTWDGTPAFALGDAAAASFHATKLFHTAEGGAVFTPSHGVLEHVRRLSSFGEQAKGEYVEAGINAKLSEVHAAVGLAVLRHADGILARRRAQSERYRSHLTGRVRFQHVPVACGYNHAYVPILLGSETAVTKLVSALRTAGIEGRRYFHPSLSTLAWVKPSRTPVADDVARRVLCLPLFHDLEDSTIDHICDVVDRGIQVE